MSACTLFVSTRRMMIVLVETEPMHASVERKDEFE